MSLDMDDDRKIAYFSMEVALEARMPTYSGASGARIPRGTTPFKDRHRHACKGDQKSKRHKDSPDREEPPYKIAPVHPHLTHAHGDLSASACALCQHKPYRSSTWSPRCPQATMQRDRRKWRMN